MTRAYYNEFDPYAAQWLRNLIDAGLIPRGDVDERSIVDVAPSDLAGYTQCHFFAGIGGWAYAARLAGWPDDRELWTGSPPCQPFSVAGAQRGTADERHLWPHLFRLIRARRPASFMGEQVAHAVGAGWLDGVFADMESIGYACRAAVVPACAVDAPHRRDRLWFVADTDIARAGEGRQQRSGELGGAGGDPGACGGGDVADGECVGVRGEGCRAPAAATRRVQTADGERQWIRADARPDGLSGSAWRDAGWIIGHDGKARRVEPSIRLLAHGVSARVGRLRAYGNAIVPQVAAEVIAAYMESRV